MAFYLHETEVRESVILYSKLVQPYRLRYKVIMKPHGLGGLHLFTPGERFSNYHNYIQLSVSHHFILQFYLHTLDFFTSYFIIILIYLYHYRSIFYIHITHI